MMLQLEDDNPPLAAPFGSPDQTAMLSKRLEMFLHQRLSLMQ
jgi:hypothetical protein